MTFKPFQPPRCRKEKCRSPNLSFEGAPPEATFAICGACGYRWQVCGYAPRFKSRDGLSRTWPCTRNPKLGRIHCCNHILTSSGAMKEETKRKIERYAQLLILGDDNGKSVTKSAAYRLVWDEGPVPTRPFNSIRRIECTPEFKEAYEAELKAFREAFVKPKIATREGQVEDLVRRREKLLSVIDSRAEAWGDDGKVPGGDTGLVVRKEVPLKGGGFLVQSAVDGGTLDQLAKIEARILELVNDAPGSSVKLADGSEINTNGGGNTIFILPSNGREVSNGSASDPPRTD